MDVLIRVIEKALTAYSVHEIDPDASPINA